MWIKKGTLVAPQWWIKMSTDTCFHSHASKLATCHLRHLWHWFDLKFRFTRGSIAQPLLWSWGKKLFLALSPLMCSHSHCSQLGFVFERLCVHWFQHGIWFVHCLSQWGLPLRFRVSSSVRKLSSSSQAKCLWAWCWWSCLIDELTCDVHGWSWLPEVWRDCCRLGVVSFELACCLTTYCTLLWQFDVGFGDVWGDAASCFVCCRGRWKVRARFVRVSVLSVALSLDLKWFIHRFVVLLVCTIHAIHTIDVLAQDHLLTWTTTSQLWSSSSSLEVQTPCLLFAIMMPSRGFETEFHVAVLEDLVVLNLSCFWVGVDIGVLCEFKLTIIILSTCRSRGCEISAQFMIDSANIRKDYSKALSHFETSRLCMGMFPRFPKWWGKH